MVYRKIVSGKECLEMNLIWICSDTFRGDYLGCMGNAAIRTPCLDALAAEGVAFEKVDQLTRHRSPVEPFALIETAELTRAHRSTPRPLLQRALLCHAPTAVSPVRARPALGASCVQFLAAALPSHGEATSRVALVRWLSAVRHASQAV